MSSYPQNLSSSRFHPTYLPLLAIHYAHDQLPFPSFSSFSAHSEQVQYTASHRTQYHYLAFVITMEFCCASFSTHRAANGPR